MVLCGITHIKKLTLNTANDEASAKLSPFHALIVLGGNAVHTG